MFRPLGTILPTRESLRLADQMAKREALAKEKIAAVELRGCERRVVGGEVRYYDTADQYAIVSSAGKVLWFAVTADGDFRIPR
jgi:hypothetical protein